MRVTQEALYDSEATLRLVDRVLEDLHMSHHPGELVELAGYRTEQLGTEESVCLVGAYWELQDALELLRGGNAALHLSPGAAVLPSDDEHERLNRALSVVDQLRSGDEDPERALAHEELRRELLALSGHFRCREEVADRLGLTAELLRDLERRLARLSRAFDSGACPSFV